MYNSKNHHAHIKIPKSARRVKAAAFSLNFKSALRFSRVPVQNANSDLSSYKCMPSRRWLCGISDPFLA